MRHTQALAVATLACCLVMGAPVLACPECSLPLQSCSSCTDSEYRVSIRARCAAQARARLQRLAKALAFATLAYCLAEGALSVTLAARDRSISLCIFGLDSLIEVASACLVLWRLFGNALDLRRERAAVLSIGGCPSHLAVSGQYAY